MGFTILKDKFFYFLPNLIGAIAVLIFGWIIAIFVEIMLNKGFTLIRLKFAKPATVSKFIKIAIIVYAVVIALEMIDAGKVIVTSTFQILLGSIGLAFGLAVGLSFGLGGKETAARLLEKWFDSKPKKKT